MKVIVKKPGLEAEICEVSGISEINKLVGNVDENGEGYHHGGTDIRMEIGKGADIYVNENASFNYNLKDNLWSPYNKVLWCGTVVFAGWDQNNISKVGACSLTQEQINFCLDFINKQSA